MTTSGNIAALGQSWSDMLCARLLVVVGIAVPVTTSLNRRVPVAPNQITDDIDGPCVHLPFARLIVSVYLPYIRNKRTNN